MRVRRKSIAAALFPLLLAGCASTQMKGTPFYTGEYNVRLGPAEDRVNLWPLLYYRDPALSVLWPIGELTEDHAADRELDLFFIPLLRGDSPPAEPIVTAVAQREAAHEIW